MNFMDELRQRLQTPSGMGAMNVPPPPPKGLVRPPIRKIALPKEQPQEVENLYPFVGVENGNQ